MYETIVGILSFFIGIYAWLDIYLLFALIGKGYDTTPIKMEWDNISKSYLFILMVLHAICTVIYMFIIWPKKDCVIKDRFKMLLEIFGHIAIYRGVIWLCMNTLSNMSISMEGGISYLPSFIILIFIFLKKYIGMYILRKDSNGMERYEAKIHISVLLSSAIVVFILFVVNIGGLDIIVGSILGLEKKSSMEAVGIVNDIDFMPMIMDVLMKPYIGILAAYVVISNIIERIQKIW